MNWLRRSVRLILESKNVYRGSLSGKWIEEVAPKWLWSSLVTIKKWDCLERCLCGHCGYRKIISIEKLRKMEKEEVRGVIRWARPWPHHPGMTHTTRKIVPYKLFCWRTALPMATVTFPDDFGSKLAALHYCQLRYRWRWTFSRPNHEQKQTRNLSWFIRYRTSDMRYTGG